MFDAWNVELAGSRLGLFVAGFRYFGALLAVHVIECLFTALPSLFVLQACRKFCLMERKGFWWATFGPHFFDYG